MIDNRSFQEWLDRYGLAWKNGDPDAAVALFAPDATYVETPFTEPMHGREAIRRYWAEGAEQNQIEVTFNYEVLDVGESEGMAHWYATFTRLPSYNKVSLDGILVATFNDDDLCTLFREWWHRREVQSNGATSLSGQVTTDKEQ